MEHGWQLRREPWDTLQCQLGNVSWRKVRFRSLDKDSVPSTSGVYAICAHPPVTVRNQLPKGLYDTLYIGKSGDLRVRFLQHLSQPREEVAELLKWFAPADELAFWFAEVDASRIHTLEAALIDCLRPPANRIKGILATVGPPRDA